ncbi:MAG: SRPBCC family protein [Novosphingobium sp.]
MRLLTVPLVVAALIAALPAHAEVVQKSDAGFIVRAVATVPATPFEAWAAMTAPAKWWNPEHTWSGKAENLYIDSQATGCFCELMPVPVGAPEGTRRGSVEHMRIVNSTPGRVLRMVGALGPLQGEAVTGVLTMTLKPAPKGTRILWEYVVGGYMRYKPDVIAPAVNAMLGEQMSRLAVQLGGAAEAPVIPEAPKAEAPAAEVAPVEHAEAVADTLAPKPVLKKASTPKAPAKPAIKPKTPVKTPVKPKAAVAKPVTEPVTLQADAPDAPPVEAPADAPKPESNSDAITPRPPV